MSKRPGIYSDIGKKAGDLLYQDYTQEPPIHFHYKFLDWSFKLSCQIKELVPPGFVTAFKFFIPYQSSNKVQLQYLHNYFGVATGINLTTKPQVNLSGVIGSSLFSIGTELSFDSATGAFTNCNAGLSFNSAIHIAALTLNDRFDTLNFSCYRSVNSLTNTAVAAEVAHGFLSNETILTLGIQHALFPITMVKARANTSGQVGALIQQKLLSSLILTIAGEVDVKAITTSGKVGLSLALGL
uniref:Mitochondrial outer membrane protein porin of 36 kDa n=1 Tax=Davidia involucrata TaxID=16924 RepID=A0A5B7ATX1_DAVIN